MRGRLSGVGSAFKQGLDLTLFNDLDKHIDAMNRLTDELTKSTRYIRGKPGEENWLVTEVEGAGLRELHGLLRETDPSRRWEQLQRVTAPIGDFLWVCLVHYREYDPGLPVIPS